MDEVLERLWFSIELSSRKVNLVVDTLSQKIGQASRVLIQDLELLEPL